LTKLPQNPFHNIPIILATFMHILPDNILTMHILTHHASKLGLLHIIAHIRLPIALIQRMFYIFSFSSSVITEDCFLVKYDDSHRR